MRLPYCFFLLILIYLISAISSCESRNIPDSNSQTPPVERLEYTFEDTLIAHAAVLKGRVEGFLYSQLLKKIRDKENGGLTSVTHKASKDDLEEYFFSVLSDYDEDRVYASDIKKIIQWYNLLHKNELLNLIDQEEDSVEEDKSEN